MGDVWRAHDTEQDRVVALKVLPPQLGRDEEYRARFRREARIVAQLNDPHIVPIHRHGEIDGQLYLDMRLIDGEDLAHVLASSGPLPAEAAVNIIEQVAAALDTAHSGDLIHRDIKPSNVLLTRARRPGEARFAYLVDFGIARPVLDPTSGPLTQTGATVGTLAYMAPERFLDRRIDARADIYSLACVLYECVSGRRPFRGTELPALMHGHLSVPPPKPSECPGVPAGLDAVIARGMAKEVAARFRSAGDLAAAARDALTLRATYRPPKSQLVPPNERARTPGAQEPEAAAPPTAPSLAETPPSRPQVTPVMRLTPSDPAQLFKERSLRPMTGVVDAVTAGGVLLATLSLATLPQPRDGISVVEAAIVGTVVVLCLRWSADWFVPRTSASIAACNAIVLWAYAAHGVGDQALTNSLTAACATSLLLLLAATGLRLINPALRRDRLIELGDVCLGATPAIVVLAMARDVSSIVVVLCAAVALVLALRLLVVPRRPLLGSIFFAPAVALTLFVGWFDGVLPMALPRLPDGRIPSVVLALGGLAVGLTAVVLLAAALVEQRFANAVAAAA